MYTPEAVARFYDQYGTREWERLDASANARLIYHLHLKFLADHIGPTRRVADIGCGAGRFSVAIAQSGSRTTLVDLSPGQLAIARDKMAEHGLDGMVDAYHAADVCDLHMLPDGAFDTVVCFGGVLSYLWQMLPQGLAELRRITRPGGTLLLSVNSRWGVFRFVLANQVPGFFANPSYWKIFEVAATGDLPPLPEVHQPPRHFFTAEDLSSALAAAGIAPKVLAAAPAISTGLYDRVAALEQEPAAWDTLLKLEAQASTNPALLDAGEFIIAAATVP
jgi:SAM-dependent methyltransferase